MNSTSAQDEDAILSSPKGSTSSKSPENTPAPSTTTATPSKKVVLKRKLLTSISLSDETPNTSTENKVSKITDEQSNEDNNGTSADGNVAKVSQMTMKERLELRAKKFGVAPTGDAAKIARAERFGVATTTKTSTSDAPVTTGISTDQKTAPNVDLLKKRAERFGGSVSNTMVKIELNEKLLKRQERFGGESSAVSTTTTKASTQATSEYAEKAKQRLERFKTSA